MTGSGRMDGLPRDLLMIGCVAELEVTVHFRALSYFSCFNVLSSF